MLPLSEKTNDIRGGGDRTVDRSGFRATVDLRNSKVQAKIRDAQLDLVPYMAVVGPKEAESSQLALRDRIEGDLGSMPVAEAIARLQAEVRERRVRQIVKSNFVQEESHSGESHEY